MGKFAEKGAFYMSPITRTTVNAIKEQAFAQALKEGQKLKKEGKTEDDTAATFRMSAITKQTLETIREQAFLQALDEGRKLDIN